MMRRSRYGTHEAQKFIKYEMLLKIPKINGLAETSLNNEGNTARRGFGQPNQTLYVPGEQCHDSRECNAIGPPTAYIYIYIYICMYTHIVLNVLSKLLY